MRRYRTPEFGLRQAVTAFGLVATIALTGCGKDPSFVTAHLNFDGINPDPELCQPTPDGSAPGFRPCFLPVRAAPGGTSDANPVLNKVDLVLPDGALTASWPYEQYDGPDDSQAGDSLKVVCTTKDETGEQFAGIETTDAHLNLSAAPDLQITMHDGMPLVYGRQKWMVADQGSFAELPGCDNYLASAS